MMTSNSPERSTDEPVESALPSVLYHCDHDPAEGLCGEDVHGWFELTYASYLILNRSLMQEMPAEWQHRMVRLLDEMGEVFEYPPFGQVHHAYLRDEHGRFIRDPLRNYRYPDQYWIEKARKHAM